MKRALIVEGGGMRGAHSAGVLTELARHNRPHFDLICGSSAGSCTVAFWVAEQYTLSEKTWADYLHDDLFIRFRNIFLRQPVMDLNYLLDEVFVQHTPLDLDKIRTSPQDFYIAATHCNTGKVHYFHNKETKDILLALKAGAALPLVYPIPVWYDGEPYADGGITDSIPIQKTLDEGCDEVWVILTRQRAYRKKKPFTPWPRWIYRKYPALAEALLTRHKHYNKSLDLVEELERQGRAYVIRPSRELDISRLTRKWSKILAAIELGKQDAARFLARFDKNPALP